LFVFFFFSSRRRHTRYWRDWSSDVCSSDLVGVPALVFARRHDVKNEQLTSDRKSTRLNSSHANISYAVFCLKKKKNVADKIFQALQIREFAVLGARVLGEGQRFFFFNDTATTEIYTLSLHDALPI